MLEASITKEEARERALAAEQDRFRRECAAFTHGRDLPEASAATGAVVETSGNFDRNPEATKLLPNGNSPTDVQLRLDAVHSFDGDVRVEHLREGDTIYRVVDERAGIDGCYWTRQRPINETQFRNDYALTQAMNGDGAYEEFTIPPGMEIAVVAGKAGPQNCRLSDGGPGHYRGGGEQLYIPRESVRAMICTGEATFHRLEAE